MLGGYFWADVLIKTIRFVGKLVCTMDGIVTGMMSFAFRVSGRIPFIAHRPLTFSAYQRKISVYYGWYRGWY